MEFALKNNLLVHYKYIQGGSESEFVHRCNGSCENKQFLSKVLSKMSWNI